MSNRYGKFLFLKTALAVATLTIVQVEHATITASKTSGTEGDIVRLTTELEEDYQLGSYTINGKTTTNSSFNMVAGENTVSAVVYKSNKLVSPTLKQVSNNYTSCSFSITNPSTIYTVNVYVNGSLYKESLDPSKSVIYTYTWGSSISERTFSVYLATTGMENSNSATIEFTRPSINQLLSPKISGSSDGAHIIFIINNENNVAVDYVADGITKGTIEANNNIAYSVDKTSATEYTIKVYFTASGYKTSETVSYTYNVDEKSLVSPVLECIQKNDIQFKISVENVNETEGSYNLYIDGIYKGSLAELSQENYTFEWGTDETQRTLSAYFTLEIDGKTITSPTTELVVKNDDVSNKLISPTFESSDSTTSTEYHCLIKNTNERSVVLYVNGLKQTIMSANSTEEYYGAWGSSATSISINCYFEDYAGKYENSSVSGIIITRPSDVVYYNLTIKYSGVSKSNETYSIKKGTTVNPVKYGSAPSGYKITGRSPSSSFTMSGDKTITITCVSDSEEVEKYTLTVSHYKNSILFKTDTYEIEAGTTVYPKTYQTTVSGYVAKTFSPSGSFAMSNNTSLMITYVKSDYSFEPSI